MSTSEKQAVFEDRVDLAFACIEGVGHNERANVKDVIETSDAMMLSDATLERAARALSPNPNCWRDFLPTARTVLTAALGAA